MTRKKQPRGLLAPDPQERGRPRTPVTHEGILGSLEKMKAELRGDTGRRISDKEALIAIIRRIELSAGEKFRREIKKERLKKFQNLVHSARRALGRLTRKSPT